MTVQIKRLAYIDELKGFGILTVILGHLAIPGMMLKLIQSFHMPLFYLISGFLFCPQKWETVRTADFARDRWKKYIVPYVELALVNYIVWGCCVGILKCDSISEYIHRLVKYAVGLVWSRGVGGYMPNCSPIWFLTSIFMLEMIWTVQRRLSRKAGKKQEVVMAGFVVINVLVAYLLDICGVVKLPWNIDSALMASFFFWSGQMLRKIGISNINENCWGGVFFWVLLIAGIGCAFLNPVEFVTFDSNHYGNLFLMLFSALTICMALLVIFRKLRLPFLIKNYLSFLGRNTIFILGFNYTANSIVGYFGKLISHYTGIPMNQFMEFILVTFVLSAGILLTNYFRGKKKC